MTKKRKKPADAVKDKSPRRSKRKLAEDRKHYQPSTSTPRTFGMAFGEPFASLFIEPGFLQDCKWNYYGGGDQALIDLVINAGPYAFVEDWVFDVLRVHWHIANSREIPPEQREHIQIADRDNISESTPTTAQRNRSIRLLKAVGEALATSGQGRSPNLARYKCLAAEYHELSPKVQRMAKPARRFAKLGGELSRDEYDHTREQLVEKYGLPIDDVDRLVEYLTGSTPLIPSRATAKLVAWHQGSSIRTVERAVKEYPRHN